MPADRPAIIGAIALSPWRSVNRSQACAALLQRLLGPIDQPGGERAGHRAEIGGAASPMSSSFTVAESGAAIAVIAIRQAKRSAHPLCARSTKHCRIVCSSNTRGDGRDGADGRCGGRDGPGARRGGRRDAPRQQQEQQEHGLRNDACPFPRRAGPDCEGNPSIGRHRPSRKRRSRAIPIDTQPADLYCRPAGHAVPTQRVLSAVRRDYI